jgi:hypothetical protein
MRIGVDFDNTIACYDGVFLRAAVERGLVPADLAEDKGSVRDYLRSIDREDDWTELQGYVYGARMDLAAPYPGVIDFFKRALTAGVDLRIISHKTRTPYRGPAYDLHDAARGFLDAHGFFDPARIGLSREKAFFELTKQDKLARIGSEGCDVFIDDLPEFLAESAFPAATRRILFDPSGRGQGDHPGEMTAADSWSRIATMLLGTGS